MEGVFFWISFSVSRVLKFRALITNAPLRPIKHPSIIDDTMHWCRFTGCRSLCLKHSLPCSAHILQHIDEIGEFCLALIVWLETSDVNLIYNPFPRVDGSKTHLRPKAVGPSLVCSCHDSKCFMTLIFMSHSFLSGMLQVILYTALTWSCIVHLACTVLWLWDCLSYCLIDCL